MFVVLDLFVLEVVVVKAVGIVVVVCRDVALLDLVVAVPIPPTARCRVSNTYK